MMYRCPLEISSMSSKIVYYLARSIMSGTPPSDTLSLNQTPIMQGGMRRGAFVAARPHPRAARSLAFTKRQLHGIGHEMLHPNMSPLAPHGVHIHLQLCGASGSK